MRLSRYPNQEFNHAVDVNNAAEKFIKRDPTITNFNAITVSHVLFSIRPEVEGKGGRTVMVTEMATDHIKTIISYAAADANAQERIDFYQKISTQPGFGVPVSKMFEGFVLSWLYACSNVAPLRCFATGQLELEIPACREGQTTFFDGENRLGKVNGDKLLPLCLLPTSKSFPTANAIVITNEFIITVQVTISDQHSAKKSGFDAIKKLIPTDLRRDNWRYVFITDDDDRAVSLRNQTLFELPKGTLVYSGVFDIGRSGVTRKHMEAYNEKKEVSGSWLHGIGAYWGITSNPPTSNPPAEIVRRSTM